MIFGRRNIWFPPTNKVDLDFGQANVVHDDDSTVGPEPAVCVYGARTTIASFRITIHNFHLENAANR